MPKFRIGNKDAEKWTEKTVNELFTKMLENTSVSDDILCLQDAIKSVNLYRSSLDYLIEKFPVFGNIKKDIQNIIISRINEKALKGKFNPAASIWRFKQLGEVDKQEHDHRSGDGSMTPHIHLNYKGKDINLEE